jgi:hypothetical protein
MKKICIISPDAVRLPLLANHPDTITLNSKEYSFEDKCVKAAATGIRAEKIANYLSSDFDVTLLIPDLNFPGYSYIDSNRLNYSIESYTYTDCQWKYSKKLNSILSKFDCIILQTTAGIAFENISRLKSKNPNIFIVLDAYIPLLAELPAALSYHTDNKKKKGVWKTLLKQYTNLFKNANLILYATDRQKYYYEGQLFLLDKLNYSNFKNSKLLKIPYGIDWHLPVEREQSEKLRLLWYGPFYPWYNFDILLDKLYNHDKIDIDFYGIKHPRYTNFVNSCISLDRIYSSSNMKIIGEFDSINPRKLFSSYDACIFLAKDWIENTYSHRARIFDVISYGIPAIINSGSSILEEDDYLNSNLIYEIDASNLVDELEDIHAFKNFLHMDIQEIHNRFYNLRNWNSVLEPLKLQLLDEIK